MDTDDGLTCTAEEDIELASATARKYGLSFHIVDLQQLIGTMWWLIRWQGASWADSQSGRDVQQADKNSAVLTGRPDRVTIRLPRGIMLLHWI